MSKNLVIVESPAKAKTIEKYLGEGYTVKSSYGHVRDLAKSAISIDIENNFNPIYEVSEDKSRVVSELKKAVKGAEIIWLASDEDREGEAIAWHLRETLKLDPEKTKRIVFNEITKTAITKAIENPRDIDINLVDAQQARRVLDRLVGYEISPILWTKIKPALSAGRVQSVAVRLIVEREDEIKMFESSSNYKISAVFEIPAEKKTFTAELPQRFEHKSEAESFLQDCIGAKFSVKKVEKKPSKKTPAAPFTTSSLQQEANRRLGFSVARTMQLAQQLYESGYITYMRTDSVNLSDFAVKMTKEEITQLYGEKYVSTHKYSNKIKGAQEAHEAIRPTDMSVQKINGDVSQRRLYELIWKRTIASQMSDALLEKTSITIDISTRTEDFIANGEVVMFDGFLRVYLETTDEEQEENTDKILPPINEGDTLALRTADATQRFTKAPARYTEASLVKKLEDLGIGRPSTYAPTISTIQKREYVIREDRDGYTRNYNVLSIIDGKIVAKEKKENVGFEKSKLFPTDIGVVVNNFLVEYFQDILDYNFTATVEKDFDEIAEGKKKWSAVISEFYAPFHKTIQLVEINSKKTKGERLLGVDPKTGKNVYAKIGRYGSLIQIGETNRDEKPLFASMKSGQSINSITLEEAISLFVLPRVAGSFDGADMEVAIGRFGAYIKHGNKNYSLPKTEDPYTIGKERCIEIIKLKRIAEAEKEKINEYLPKVLGKYVGTEVVLNTGKYGPYVTYDNKNYRLPKGTDIYAVSLKEGIEVIEKKTKK